MSYLTTPELPAFSKAVISFWFKAPQAAIDAAAAQAKADEDKDPPPPLNGIVPLLVFGKEGQGVTGSESHTTTSGGGECWVTHVGCVQHMAGSGGGCCSMGCITYWAECSSDTFMRLPGCSPSADTSYSPTPGGPSDPSYVGLDCSGEGEVGAPTIGRLIVRFESATKGKSDYPSGVGSSIPGCDLDCGGSSVDCLTASLNLECVGGMECCGCICVACVCFPICGSAAGMFGGSDFESTGSQMPDAEPPTDPAHPDDVLTYVPLPGDYGSGAIVWKSKDALDADKWHHVLISVDMSKGSAAKGSGCGEEMGELASHFSETSLLYVAIDDKNILTGDYQDRFPGTNKVAIDAAAAAAGSSQTCNALTGGGEGAIPSYSQSDMQVPSAPVGIPCVEKYVDRIRSVDMAEFLFFTGEVLDTGNVDNRRHFITNPDKNGKQRPTNSWPLFIPMRKFAVGDPFYWEDGADNPAFAPPLFDPSAWPTGIKGLGTAEIDFTKCSWNWQMGRNIGKLKGKVVKTGKIKEDDADNQPAVSAS